MTLIDAEELNFEQAHPRPPARVRRIAVVVLGTILAGVACGIISLTFVQGSWWYSYGTDRALDRESRARVEAIRDEVDASGVAPEVVVWLNAALEPDAHPTDVRAYLLAAQEALKPADDPKLAGAVRELRAITQAIRSSGVREMVTPCPEPMLEWPW
jgi:hypothetical protein